MAENSNSDVRGWERVELWKRINKIESEIAALQRWQYTMGARLQILLAVLMFVITTIPTAAVLWGLFGR